MDRQHKVEELYMLKVIAETLNTSNDWRAMLQHVLEKLIEVMSLKSGWLFLVGDRPEFQFVAHYGLPPALSWDNQKPMCEGSCFCLSNHWEGRLNQPVNIINCKRLEDARRLEWGETNGITHHATVPISASGETLGLLNVACPEKETFTEDELNLLQAVALQIGTALKRTRLYEIQEWRGLLYAKLDVFSQRIYSFISVNELTNQVATHILQAFNWNACALYLRSGEDYQLKSTAGNDPMMPFPQRGIFENVSLGTNKISWDPSFLLKERRRARQKRTSGAVIPLQIGDETLGCLVILGIPHSESHKKAVLEDIFRAVAAHIVLAYENLKLYEKQRELEVLEERNRLARDLHDSVNQKLFSLSLTAKGAASLSEENAFLKEALSDIQVLSQEALKEMKALIWQLRPVGLEEGLIQALRNYAQQLGLSLHIEASGFIQIPQKVEEGLYRLVQEALNNVKKHAGVEDVWMDIEAKTSRMDVTIRDDGKGFDLTQVPSSTLGLTSMRERASLLGGACDISSLPDQGTNVVIQLPLVKGEGEGHDH